MTEKIKVRKCLPSDASILCDSCGTYRKGSVVTVGIFKLYICDKCWLDFKKAVNKAEGKNSNGLGEHDDKGEGFIIYYD